MNSQSNPSNGPSQFVDALVGIGGQLTSVIHHMLQAPAPPDARSIPEVLSRLLTEIVTTELDHDDATLALAAQVLDDTSRAIEENLFLVPPDATLN